jgi:hypothetical protein
LFVNAIRAVMPSGPFALSASWIAWSSGFDGGVGPPPPAATAIAVPPTASATTTLTTRIRLRVESRRR